MAETLGSLCDKLTIIKLKQWHATEAGKQNSLATQEIRLQKEIDDFVIAAASGLIPARHLTFDSNKVFKQEGNIVSEVAGNIGEVVSLLAEVNCELWHEQEKVYEFESISPENKDGVVKQLALLNLKRNKCIDQIDRALRDVIERKQSKI